MTLSRRQFLISAAGAAGAAVAGLTMARHPWTALTGGPTSSGSASADGKGTLVLLTLYGGNDGLNTVIPYQDGHYLGGRSQLGYQPNEVIPLSDGLALHPNMKGMKALWDRRQLAIVRGVGYPNPSRSHFRSMDIWQSGVPEWAVPSGWLGRWLDGTGTDPLRALAVGANLPRAMTGEKVAAAAVPVGPLDLPGGSVGTGFASLAGAGASPAPLAARIIQVDSDLLKVDKTVADLLASQPTDEAANHATNLDGQGGTGTPPTTAKPAKAGQSAKPGKPGKPAKGSAGTLASQLGLVARLVKAGSPSRAYGVSLGGFDTHANEKETHARLWAEVDAAVSGFFTELAGNRHGDSVVLLAHSEFGRRVAANASGGTDHGTAAPVFVVGPQVKGGFYGDEPTLTDLDAGDLKFTTDFRSVYATVLDGVIGVDPKQALGKPFKPLAFL
ncbi:MAG: DUF1501 domain-containing protein [Acidimicrobiales bacterium]